jgi:hypothetical protein
MKRIREEEPKAEKTPEQKEREYQKKRLHALLHGEGLGVLLNTGRKEEGK